MIWITEGISNVSGGLAGKTGFLQHPISLKNKKSYRYMHLTLRYVLQNGSQRSHGACRKEQNLSRISVVRTNVIPYFAFSFAPVYKITHNTRATICLFS